MSYVLEALRRADAERHSGAVPDLHAQPLPAPQGEAPAHVRSNRWWAWLALAAMVAAGVLWVMAQRPAAVPAPVSLPAPPPAAPAVAAAARATEAPAVAAQPVPPMPVSRLPPEPRPAAAQAAAAPAPATPASAGATAAVPPLARLPEALRRQLPPLVFGGATDSPSAASRMLIINGQLFREGDEPAPGLVLERIALRSAQMRFRGQRFEVAY